MTQVTPRRHDDQPVPAAPGEPVEPGWNVGTERTPRLWLRLGHHHRVSLHTRTSRKMRAGSTPVRRRPEASNELRQERESWQIIRLNPSMESS